jgi:hypothetical protein
MINSVNNKTGIMKRNYNRNQLRLYPLRISTDDAQEMANAVRKNGLCHVMYDHNRDGTDNSTRRRFTLPYLIVNEPDCYLLKNRDYENIIRVPKNNVTWDEFKQIGCPCNSDQPDNIWFYGDRDIEGDQFTKEGRIKYLAAIIFLNRNLGTKFCI